MQIVEKTNVTVNEKPSLLKFIWRPVTQFENIKARPDLLWQLVIITLLYTLGSSIIAFNLDLNAILKNVQGVEENRQMFTAILIGSAAISGLTTPIFNILFTSTFCFVIAKLAKSEVSFRQLFSMNTHIMIIGVIGLLLNSLLLYLLHINNLKMITSIGPLLGNPALNKIEVFGIWQTILIGVGLRIVARLPKGLCWAISILLFVLMILFSFIFPDSQVYKL